MESKKTQIKIGKGRFFGIITVLFTILLLFAPWVKNGKAGVMVFMEDISEIHGCLGAAKVFAIITLVVGIIYVILLAINFVKLVPGLKKFKFGFNRLFGLVYYGLYWVALLLNLIGCGSSDFVKPTVRSILIFIFMILLIVLYAIPAISKFANKHFDLVLE